jgi:hypothetical protein
MGNKHCFTKQLSIRNVFGDAHTRDNVDKRFHSKGKIRQKGSIHFTELTRAEIPADLFALEGYGDT